MIKDIPSPCGTMSKCKIDRNECCGDCEDLNKFRREAGINMSAPSYPRYLIPVTLGHRHIVPLANEDYY